MNIISIVFTIIFILLFAIYIRFALKRDTKKNIFSIISNAISFIVSFIITRISIIFISEPISKLFKKFIEGVFDIRSEYFIKDTAINEFSKFLTTIIIGIIIFILVYLIILLINNAIKKFIFHKIIGEKYKEYKSKNNNIYINLILGVFSFLITSFAFLFPFGAISNIAGKVEKTCNYKMPENMSSIIKNPIIKAYSLVGSRPFFDTLTEIENNKNNIKNSKEFESIFTISCSTLQIYEGNNVDKNVNIIEDSLSKNYLTSSLISELVSNVAYNLKNGNDIMNTGIIIPKDNSEQLVVGVLDILSKWERQNLIEDVDTVLNIYDMLKSRDINSIDDLDKLLNSLADEQFNEELFLELFENDDFKNMIPVVMKFGIDSALNSLDIKTNTEYIASIDFSTMSEEDVKNEAKIFSAIFKQILQIENKGLNNLTTDDLITIITNIKGIKTSKIFNDMLYNLIYQLVSDI